LACAVAPRGHVFTFEYHQQRAEMARTDFEKLGVAPFITVTHRDAVANGFAVESDANDKLAHWADAVFLDLPNPSAAIAHAVVALKPAIGRLCSFSPCIEQVQATCSALRDAQFHGIETIECLIQPLAMTRPFFDTITVPVHLPKKARIDRTDMPRQVQEIRGHTSYLTFASAPCVRREQETPQEAAATSVTTTAAAATTITTETETENNTTTRTNEEEL
jgi:tRNA (adenine57-N1/adenine58-N1)-methyltransferase